MALANRAWRTAVQVAGALVVAAGAGALYLYWTGASVGLAGSGKFPVVEYVDNESRFRELEEDRAREAFSLGHPERGDLAASSHPMARPAAAPASAGEGGANYWTDYRGPLRNGIYDQAPLRLDWPPEGPPELWRQQVGGGYASMVIADSLVYTIEQRRNREVVAAYALEDGRQVWEHAWNSRFSESMGGDGPRATPTWSDGRVYALGANGDLACLSASDGSPVWKRNILRDAAASNLTWGMAGAPLLVDGMVVVIAGGGNGRSLFAYDELTGEILWSALDDKAGYVSPQVATLAGRRQLLLVTGTRIVGASLEDGSELWSRPWKTSYDANCAQPLVVDDNHVFVSSGYGHGATLLQISAVGDRFSVEEVWFNRNMKNKFNPSVLVDGVVYGLDEGILAAVDVRSGERHWKRGRYRYGQLLYASGHLIVISEDGDLALVEATPDEYRELVRFESIPGKTWNVPAIADGVLLVRNQTEMVAYDLR